MTRGSTALRKRLKRSRRLRQAEILTRRIAPTTGPLRFDASLRIMGIGKYHDEIALKTGLTPGIVGRKGEARFGSGKFLHQADIWVLRSPLGEFASLEEHLDWLWKAIAPFKPYFASLIEKSESADVCLGCLSESVYPFFVVDPAALAITRELNVGLSFNFTCV